MAMLALGAALLVVPAIVFVVDWFRAD